MIGVVVVMVAAVPWTAIPVIPLGIVFFFLRRYFLETSRDVKRLECTSEYRALRLGGQCSLSSIDTAINQTSETLQIVL